MREWVLGLCGALTSAGLESSLSGSVATVNVEAKFEPGSTPLDESSRLVGDGAAARRS